MDENESAEPILTCAPVGAGAGGAEGNVSSVGPTGPLEDRIAELEAKLEESIQLGARTETRLIAVEKERDGWRDNAEVMRNLEAEGRYTVQVAQARAIRFAAQVLRDDPGGAAGALVLDELADAIVFGAVEVPL